MLEILRSTLEEVKTDPAFPPDDPKVIEVKQSLEESIRKLESAQLRKAA